MFLSILLGEVMKCVGKYPDDLSHVPCRCPISRDSRSMGTFSISSPPKLHCYHQLARAVDLVPVDKYHIIREYHVSCSMSLESEADLHWFQTIAVGSICKETNLTSRRPFAQYRHERSPHPYETSAMACLLQQTPPGCQRWKTATSNGSRVCVWHWIGCFPIPTRHKKVGGNIQKQFLAFGRFLTILSKYDFTKANDFFLKGRITTGITTPSNSTFSRGLFGGFHVLHHDLHQITRHSQGRACACHRKGFPRPLWIQTWFFWMVEFDVRLSLTDLLKILFEYVLLKKMTVQKWREYFWFGGMFVFFGGCFVSVDTCVLSSCHHFNGVQQSQRNVMKSVWDSSFISVTASLCLAQLHPRKLTWIPKMMVWKRGLLSNMAIFGIYVRFLGGI